jgi:hypothetical protein
MSTARLGASVLAAAMITYALEGIIGYVNSREV